MPRPDLSLPIEAQGHLRLESPSGRVLNLAARGSTVELDSPTLADLQALLPGPVTGLRSALARTERALTPLGLGLQVSISGRSLLQLGAGNRANLAGRLLGLDSGRLSLQHLLGAWIRER